MEIDDNGVVRVPNLHDAKLDGIVVSVRDQLSLFCTVGDASRLEIRVPKVRYLRADNVRESNIIFDVKVISGSNASLETLAWLLYHDGPAQAEQVGRMAGDLERATATLIEITSSYGCRLAALAEVPAQELSVHDL